MSYYPPERIYGNCFDMFERKTAECLDNKTERAAQIALVYLRSCMEMEGCDVKQSTVQPLGRRVTQREIKSAVLALKELLTVDRTHHYLELMQTWVKQK